MMLDALEQTNLLHSIAEEPGSAFFLVEAMAMDV